MRAIGSHGRFVLVETPSISAAALLLPGRRLHCRAASASGPLSTADLRVTREREQATVAADVLAGEPQVGDAVFLAAGTEPSPASAGPSLPISSVLPPLPLGQPPPPRP